MGDHKSIGGVTPFLKLREGRWADVYKAYDASLERYVLLKVLNRHATSNTALARQFEAEARLMAKIQHPNVVPVLAYGKEQDHIYFTAAFIDGHSIRAILDERTDIPALIALEMMQDMVAGLDAAHQQNILHRDLKPANVLLSSDGHVLLADFGMAFLQSAQRNGDASGESTEQPAIMGTPAYLAPELITGSPPSVQTDLFALGATFYEMLAGRPAFRGEDTSALFDNILHYDPLPLLQTNTGIPPAILTLCANLLHKNPGDRPESARAVLQEIKSIRHALHSAAPGYSGPEALQQFASSPATFRISTSIASPVTATPDTAAPENVTSDTTAPPEAASAPARQKRNKFVRAALPLALLIGLVLILYNIFDSPATDNTTFNARDYDTGEMQTPAGPSAETTPAEPDDVQPPSTASATAGVSGQEGQSTAPLQNNPATVPEIEIPDTAETPASISPPRPVSTQSALAADTLDHTSESAPAGDNLATGAINILCTPWCEVDINGQNYGQAPPNIRAALPPGSYQLTLHNPHYPVFEETISITPAAEDTLRLAFKDLVGTIELEVFPWAEVTIDSVSYGTVPPAQTIVLAPGEHLLTLTHDELGSWSTRLIVAAGEQRRQPYNLEELLRTNP